MLKFKPGVVTKTHIGHGTYIYNDPLSETLFIPVDIEKVFRELQHGVSKQNILKEAILSEAMCTEEEAMLVIKNTLDSLFNKGLLES